MIITGVEPGIRYAGYPGFSGRGGGGGGGW